VQDRLRLQLRQLVLLHLGPLHFPSLWTRLHETPPLHLLPHPLSDAQLTDPHPVDKHHKRGNKRHLIRQLLVRFPVAFRRLLNPLHTPLYRYQSNLNYQDPAVQPVPVQSAHIQAY